MDWRRALSRLERDVIKPDVMANTDADFLATHVPFDSLLVQFGGKTSATTKLWSEEEVFSNLVANTENQHRLVIVRGSNGAGKSHLIRWLRARFDSSGMRKQQADKVVFIRRLGNSFRGAVSQLLDEGVVQDPDLEARLRSFVVSADSLNERDFMSTIHSGFVNEVLNDKREEPYKATRRLDIAGFLNDPRVREALLAEGGPVYRCYAQIVKASKQIFGGEAAFTAEDFVLDKQLVKEVSKRASEEAQRYTLLLRSEEEERAKLADYLNGFTQLVVNRCANISFGDTREVFAQLRRDLQRQGKNLTVFIEDFTSFRNVDSELLTVLATEHGGANSDLCRVTSIVGITDGYYEQFKDNFTDRVTHQIVVDENAYSEDSFLSELTARYLNAVFTSREQVETWYESGAEKAQLPLGEFQSPLPWETQVVEGKHLTLYPFNKQAVRRLYSRLKPRTPREFLRMLQEQLGAFIQDQLDGTLEKFPLPVNGVLNWAVPEHESFVDRLDKLPGYDRERLARLLCLWGNATAYQLGDDQGTTIGGLPVKFLTAVGLGQASGVEKDKAVEVIVDVPKRDKPTPDITPAQIPPAQRQYEIRKRSIQEWYQQGKPLNFSADLRRFVKQFLASAIMWPAEGVSAYIADKRLQSEDLVFIEGQVQENNADRALVCIERGPEGLDILQGLLAYDYHKGWGFASAAYYQLVLVECLERIKPELMKAVTGQQGGAWPIYRWAMAIEYYRLALTGRLTGSETTEDLLGLMFEPGNLQGDSMPARSGKWDDLRSWLLQQQAAQLRENKSILIESAKTYMGVVGEGRGGSVPIYRAAEIIDTLSSLQNDNWLPMEVASGQGPQGARSSAFLVLSYNLLRATLGKLPQALRDAQDGKGELDQATRCMQKLHAMLGNDLSSETFYQIGVASEQFLALLSEKSIVYQEVKRQDAVALHESADRLASLCKAVEASLKQSSLGKLLAYYSSNPCSSLLGIIRTMELIQGLAKKYEHEMENRLRELAQSLPNTISSDELLDKLDRLAERVERLGGVDVDPGSA